MTADSPWGAGNPFVGQLKGCPSIPRSVYSCSMPNQIQCSLTCSITLLQLARWLVSKKEKKQQNLFVLNLTAWNYDKKTWTDLWKLPAGKRLYLRTSQRTSLLGSRVNGSLNMRAGTRYMSLLEPSAWYVLEPSKFHSGISDEIRLNKRRQ